MNASAVFAVSALAALTVLSPVRSAHAQHKNMQHGGSHAMGMAGMQSLKTLKGKPFDVAFLSQMIAHHQGALTMSRDAMPALKDKHVREHAQNIITSQKKEIAEMTTLLRSDYKTKPATAHMNKMKADMKGMMSMKPGSDQMFLQMMTPHHQGAIEMSRLALKNSSSPKVKALANRIIKDQSAEIGDFQKMLKQGVGPGAAHNH
jgi:uncharacterized protein (DUF305 family)